jgi:hypothetical protein
LPIDLQANIRNDRLHLDHDLRDPRLDLLELGPGLVDRRLKRGRRSRGKRRARYESVRFARFDELAEGSLALGDS